MCFYGGLSLNKIVGRNQWQRELVALKYIRLRWNLAGSKYACGKVR